MTQRKTFHKNRAIELINNDIEAIKMRCDLAKKQINKIAALGTRDQGIQACIDWLENNRDLFAEDFNGAELLQAAMFLSPNKEK